MSHIKTKSKARGFQPYIDVNLNAVLPEQSVKRNHGTVPRGELGILVLNHKRQSTRRKPYAALIEQLCPLMDCGMLYYLRYTCSICGIANRTESTINKRNSMEPPRNFRQNLHNTTLLSNF